MTKPPTLTNVPFPVGVPDGSIPSKGIYPEKDIRSRMSLEDEVYYLDNRLTAARNAIKSLERTINVADLVCRDIRARVAAGYSTVVSARAVGLMLRAVEAARRGEIDPEKLDVPGPVADLIREIAGGTCEQHVVVCD